MAASTIGAIGANPALDSTAGEGVWAPSPATEMRAATTRATGECFTEFNIY
jgi:hypothetical protein